METGNLPPFARNFLPRTPSKPCRRLIGAVALHLSSGLAPHTLHATKRAADEARPAGFRCDPRPRLPRRLVPHMLRVTALEVGDPMTFIILMEPDDPSWNRRILV